MALRNYGGSKGDRVEVSASMGLRSTEVYPVAITLIDHSIFL